MVQSTCSESTERYLLEFKLKNDSSDPDTPKPERLKSLGHLSNQFKKKTRLGSHHSEKKMEFLGQIQRKKPLFIIGKSNQPSNVKTVLTSPRNKLVCSPPCGI